jgi:chromate transporter
MRVAALSFGGPAGQIAVMHRIVVEEERWLDEPRFLHALSYRHPGGLSPLAAGVAASVVTTWVTFVPCFLRIFVGAPFIEQLRGNRPLASPLRLLVPRGSTLDVVSLGLALGASVAMLRFHVGVVTTIAVTALVGGLVHALR